MTARRASVTTAMALGLGVALTLAMAWLGAIVPPSSWRIIEDSSLSIQLTPGPMWDRYTILFASADSPPRCPESPDQLLRRVQAASFHNDNFLSSSWAHNTRFGWWTCTRSGWPMRCFWGWTFESDAEHVQGGCIRTSWLWNRRSYLAPAIPLKPIWLPLMMNVFCFTGMIVAPVCIAGWLRRNLRRRRSQCPSCSYDLRATPAGLPCPECGRSASASVQISQAT